MPLKPKQQRFVDEYLFDQNATQAYKRAGYKVRSDHAAQVASSRLLLNVVVSEKIKAGLALLAETAGITADDVWRELACIAFSNIGDILDMTGTDLRLKPGDQIPESARRAIKPLKVKRYVEGTG